MLHIILLVGPRLGFHRPHTGHWAATPTIAPTEIRMRIYLIFPPHHSVQNQKGTSAALHMQCRHCRAAAMWASPLSKMQQGLALSVSLPVWGPVGLITVGGCRRAAKRAGSTAAMAMACLTALSGGEDRRKTGECLHGPGSLLPF